MPPKRIKDKIKIFCAITSGIPGDLKAACSMTATAAKDSLGQKVSQHKESKRNSISSDLLEESSGRSVQWSAEERDTMTGCIVRHGEKTDTA